MAVALGYPHPDLMLAQLTAKQLAELRAFYRFEPFDLQRTEAALARIAQLVGGFGGVKIAVHDLIMDATRIRDKRAVDEKTRYENTKRQVARFYGVDPDAIQSVTFHFTKPKKK